MRKLSIGLVRTADPLNLCTDLTRSCCEFLESLENVTLFRAEKDIGEAADAEEICAAFEKNKIDLTLVMCCSLVGDGRVIQPFMHSSQEVAVWCVPEPTKEGPLLLNSMTCANLYTSTAHLMEKETGGKQVKWLYGSVEDPLMRRRLQTTIRALAARKNLKGATIVQIGKTADGFINLGYDAQAIERNLGVKVIYYSLPDVFHDMECVDAEKAEELGKTMTQGACCCTATREELVTSARLMIAVRGLKEKFDASAFAISCWPEFQDDMHISTCLAFGRLGEEGIPVSCEGDVPGALSMLLGKELSDERPMLMDMVAMNEEADAISFWHCGMGLPCYADAAGFGITQYPADERVFTLPGASVDIKFAPRKVTVLRFDGTGSNLLACNAEIVSGPDRGYDGARGWYSNFTMDGKKISCVEFLDMVLCGGNPHHYAICPGELGDCAREFALRCGLTRMLPEAYTDSLR